MWDISPKFGERLERVIDDTDWSPSEKPVLRRLMSIFAKRRCPPDPFGMFKEYDGLKQQFVDAVLAGDGWRAEEAFLLLYCHVHGYQAPYTTSERAELDRLGGYWCHAGGISPLLKAGAYLTSESVSADLGAGNGLQGLLLQKLFPHKKTIQIELSSTMVAAGRCLAQWLDIPSKGISWRVGDVRNFSPAEVDFLYLYRPMRPEGPGKRFYETLAEQLKQMTHSVTIFSVADCLAPYLTNDFHEFYCDGHLKCIANYIPDSGIDRKKKQ